MGSLPALGLTQVVYSTIRPSPGLKTVKSGAKQTTEGKEGNTQKKENQFM